MGQGVTPRHMQYFVGIALCLTLVKEMQAIIKCLLQEDYLLLTFRHSVPRRCVHWPLDSDSDSDTDSFIWIVG